MAPHNRFAFGFVFLYHYHGLRLLETARQVLQVLEDLGTGIFQDRLDRPALTYGNAATGGAGRARALARIFFFQEDD